MTLKDAMAGAILRAILERPLLSTVSDERIPSELWDAAYECDKLDKTVARLRRAYVDD
jgi:hypothetical protein